VQVAGRDAVRDRGRVQVPGAGPVSRFGLRPLLPRRSAGRPVTVVPPRPVLEPGRPVIPRLPVLPPRMAVTGPGRTAGPAVAAPGAALVTARSSSPPVPFRPAPVPPTGSTIPGPVIPAPIIPAPVSPVTTRPVLEPGRPVIPRLPVLPPRMAVTGPLGAAPAAIASLVVPPPMFSRRARVVRPAPPSPL
jgi:hypothetical protein